MRLLAQASDAQLRIGESILTIVVIDSGLALRAPRNDEICFCWICYDPCRNRAIVLNYPN
jgi:hypothetical protein